MKGREGLNSVRRLCRLLSKSREGGIGVGKYIPQLPRQVCSDSSSSLDDSAVDPSSNVGGLLSNKIVRDRISSSSFTDLQSSTFIPPLVTGLASLSDTSRVGLVRCSPVQSRGASVHIFNRLIRVYAVPFATLREKWQEDRGEDLQEVEKEGHENPGPSKLGSQRQRKTPMIDTGRVASPEEPSISDTVSESEVLSGNAKAIDKGHEVELGSVSEEARKEVGWSEMGWKREEVLNVPNAISMGRLLCGPLLSWMILHELWSPAFVGLVIAGISDWLDGHMARKMHINSVLGSYLDPVADKFLVGSVTISMAYAGLLHRKWGSILTIIILWEVLIFSMAAALVGLIVARDGVLMGGAFFYRAYSLRWQWNDWQEFFRISIGGAQKVEPLFISKVNTVLQLALVGVALLEPALSIEDTYSIVPLLSWSVVATTSISWAAYAYIFWKNPENLAILRHAANAPSPRARS